MPKLTDDVEKDRRQWFSLTNVLTLLGMAAAVAVTYADNRVENAKQKERVDNLKETVHEVRKDSKDTNSKVNEILRKLESWEAAQRERERLAKERGR